MKCFVTGASGFIGANLVRELLARGHSVRTLLRPGADTRGLTGLQFERVQGLCDGEKEFLHGALDIYQSRTETKMNYTMERLAVLAVVTLPITALASVYGMNIIVNYHTDFAHLTVVVLVMVAMSALLLRWAHRQGWW